MAEAPGLFEAYKTVGDLFVKFGWKKVA